MLDFFFKIRYNDIQDNPQGDAMGFLMGFLHRYLPLILFLCMLGVIAVPHMMAERYNTETSERLEAYNAFLHRVGTLPLFDEGSQLCVTWSKRDNEVAQEQLQLLEELIDAADAAIAWELRSMLSRPMRLLELRAIVEAHSAEHDLLALSLPLLVNRIDKQVCVEEIPRGAPV